VSGRLRNNTGETFAPAAVLVPGAPTGGTTTADDDCLPDAQYPRFLQVVHWATGAEQRFDHTKLAAYDDYGHYSNSWFRSLYWAVYQQWTHIVSADDDSRQAVGLVCAAAGPPLCVPRLRPKDGMTRAQRMVLQRVSVDLHELCPDHIVLSCTPPNAGGYTAAQAMAMRSYAPDVIQNEIRCERLYWPSSLVLEPEHVHGVSLAYALNWQPARIEDVTADRQTLPDGPPGLTVELYDFDTDRWVVVDYQQEHREKPLTEDDLRNKLKAYRQKLAEPKPAGTDVPDVAPAVVATKNNATGGFTIGAFGGSKTESNPRQPTHVEIPDGARFMANGTPAGVVRFTHRGAKRAVQIGNVKLAVQVNPPVLPETPADEKP